MIVYPSLHTRPAARLTTHPHCCHGVPPWAGGCLQADQVSRKVPASIDTAITLRAAPLDALLGQARATPPTDTAGMERLAARCRELIHSPQQHPLIPALYGALCRVGVPSLCTLQAVSMRVSHDAAAIRLMFVDVDGTVEVYDALGDSRRFMDPAAAFPLRRDV